MSFDLEAIKAVVTSASRSPQELDLICSGIASLVGTPGGRGIEHASAEYVVHIGLYNTLARLEASLRELEPFKITPAPVVAASFAGRETQVVVLRYWACVGENLAKLDAPLDTIPRDARVRFRDDLRRMAEAGYMHPFAHRGTLYWRRSDTTSTIVLASWLALQLIADVDEDPQRVFREIDKMLRLE